MVTFDPAKKKTKRGFWRTLNPFSSPAADVRRARLQTQDVTDAREKLRKQRSLNADVKALKRAGILK